MSDELVKKVTEWLHGEGYPLEFATQHAFADAGFDARQGQHVRDEETGAVREIDVLADMQTKTKTGFIRCAYVAECKSNRKNPWVAFMRKPGLATKACIAQTICNRAGHKLLLTKADSLALHALQLFRRRDTSAFAGCEAFKSRDARDGFYSALQSVVSVSTLYANEHNTSNLKVVVFPMVVVAGPLLTASYDAATEAMTVAEVPEVRFHWRGAEAWQLHSTVDVVSAAGVTEWAQRRSADVRKVIEVLSE